MMAFCTEREYQEFMRSCPEFERMLVRPDIHLIKYWFSISDEKMADRPVKTGPGNEKPPGFHTGVVHRAGCPAPL